MLNRPEAHGLTPEVHRSIAPIASEWDELADREAAPPFLRPGWFAAWWSAFGRGSLEILALRRRGTAVAVLPMARHRGALLSLSNWHTPMYSALVESGAEHALTALVLTLAARRMTVAFVDPCGPMAAACKEAAVAGGRPSLIRVVQRSPFLPIDGSFERFERERFSSRHRALLKRRRRQLMDAGALSVEVSTGEDDLERRLDDGFEVEALSWKGQAGTAIVSRPDTRRFYTDVAQWAAARGELRLAFLRVDGRPVAFDLALESAGAHYLLKTGYDPAYKRLGPGAVLQAEMVARAFARGLDVYEFLGHEARWKLDWTDQSHERATLHLFSRGPIGRLEWATYAHALPAARKVAARVRR